MRLPWLLGLSLLVSSGVVLGQTRGDISAYITLASDYPHRGLSQTDGGPALQAGVDYQHRSGFFAGGWASNVEFSSESSRQSPRSVELDFYGGYHWVNRDWSLAATISHYAYPNTSVSYDYSELTGSVGFRDRFFYTASYTDGILSHDASALGHELGIEWPLPWETRLGGSIGRFESDDVRGGSYDHWNVGVSKQIERMSLDVRFYDTNYDRVSPLGAPLKKSWVVSLSYQI